MANEQNLKPLSERTKAEQRRIATAGGIASGKARREKKAFREYIEAILEEEGLLNGKPATKKEIISARAVQILLDPKAKNDDFLKAFEKVRDTIGEKPIERAANIIEDASLERMKQDYAYTDAGEEPDTQ